MSVSKRLRCPSDWRQSVARFFDLGLERQTMLDAVRDAQDRPRLRNDRVFRYFCGICWRTLQERQDIATGLLAKEEGDSE